MSPRPLIYDAFVPHIFDRHLVPGLIGGNAVVQQHRNIDDSWRHRWRSGCDKGGAVPYRSAEVHLL
jgi:hypothetical protein